MSTHEYFLQNIQQLWMKFVLSKGPTALGFRSILLFHWVEHYPLAGTLWMTLAVHGGLR